MKRLLMLTSLLGLVAAAAYAQEPEVDRSEVLRLGDTVQHTDGIGSDPVDAFVAAMGPPASDADKWFVSILTTQGCAPCGKLKSDWSASPWLLALADPSDPKKSWAHFNVYTADDKSQSFRFEQLKVESYPTILVQPPRSGRYGDPKTVVFQSTYGGDPERLARQITSAIRLYVSKLEASQPPAQTGSSTGPVGIDPPWTPPPRLEPPLQFPTPSFPEGRPLIPPIVEPSDSTTPTAGPWNIVWTAAGTSVLTLLLAVGLPWALQRFRQWRLETGSRPLLSDEQFQRLLESLRTAAPVRSNASGNPSEPSSAAGGS